MDFIQSFRQSMMSDGIKIHDEIIPDGKLHRFHITGDDPSSKNGWYAFYNDGLPNGNYGCWKRNIKRSWCVKSKNHMTLSELHLIQNRAIAAKNQLAALRKSASVNAKILWEQSNRAISGHPYLARKKVNSYGLRVDKTNRLVIPIHNSTGELCSLQYISPSGEKRFLKGSSPAGGYYLFGELKNPTDRIYIGEGYATCATIFDIMNCVTVCCFNCNNIMAATKLIKDKYPQADIIIAADNDIYTSGNPGLNKAREIATAIGTKIIYPKFLNNDSTSKPTDFNDMVLISGKDAVRNTLASINIKPLKNQNLPSIKSDVMQLLPEMLPETIRDYVFDVAERQQSSPDFVAVAAIVGLSALLGRKALIKPKQHDDWEVTPNQWGAIIGRPAAMKSPSMNEALKPLRQIDCKAAETFSEEFENFKAEKILADIEQNEAKKIIRKTSKADRQAALKQIKDMQQLNELPKRPRLIVNDSTVEKLGELLNENPNGLILIRDELTGWLSILMREDGQKDRSFYLECYEGNNRYTYDRIGRGTIEIENCILSIIGGIQPDKITILVRNAMRGGNDGLIQRFQLTVWPDDNKTFSWIDRKPHQEAKAYFYDAFTQMHSLKFDHQNDNAKILNFSHDAQSLFATWVQEMQTLARSDDMHPLLESHLLKMPKTIAGLALLFEIVEGGRDFVGMTATNMALKWAKYLLSHARRLYNSVINQSLHGAHLIIKRRSKLSALFSTREILRKGWAYLDNMEIVTESLNWLIDYGYLIKKEISSTQLGGRPTTTYEWNTEKIENMPDTELT